MALDIARLRLGDAKHRIDKFIDANMVQWAEEEVLTEAQKRAWNRGLSENAISSMYIEKVDFKKWKIVWDYRGPNNEPISSYLEDGTPAHEIYAKGKDFGGSNWLHWLDKTGHNVFRKKVKHPGTTGMHIIRDAWKNSKQRFQKRMKKEVQAYLELTKIGG
jgi:hypothetical protein